MKIRAMQSKWVLGFIGIILCITACKSSRDWGPIEPGNDPNFLIEAHSDEGLEDFNRKVVVFGIDIYAVPDVEDEKLLHAANVMAQYLDNDEDGLVDDTLVWSKMIEQRAFVVMWKRENDLNIDPPADRLGQDLGNDETEPDYVVNGKIGPFDASLEEVLHIINFAGHALAYPNNFGLAAGSDLANAMDIARGGQFFDVPDEYPAEAWYTYDDETCSYADCQTIEYLYWAITSLMGGQENRLDEIGHEWRLNTPALVESGDTAIFELLTNPTFKIPVNLPDGRYRQ